MQRRVSDEVLDSGEDQWYLGKSESKLRSGLDSPVVVSEYPAAGLRWEVGEGMCREPLPGPPSMASITAERAG